MDDTLRQCAALQSNKTFIYHNVYKMFMFVLFLDDVLHSLQYTNA